MNAHVPNITHFNCHPREAINLRAAMSLDKIGHAHMLAPGERFVGFSAEYRDPVRDDSKLSAVVQFEGVEELPVDDFTPADFGRTVFATGPTTFTVDPKKSPASPIGYVVGVGDYKNLLVKFFSQPKS